MHQPSRRHRYLAPGAQELILEWLLERENSPTAYTNHHASDPAKVTRTKSQQCHSSGLHVKQSVSTPPKRALREGRCSAHRSPPLNLFRWSPYPERHPAEKRTIPDKGSQGGYERKPRNKTKEDRYEYKGSTSRIQRKQSPIKAKTKQVRRHTINDKFHASNVPRDRLTLHSHLDLGIFRRGKTSSPVKAGELRHFPHFSGVRRLVNRGRLSEEGFSETGFLSRKLRSDSEKYTTHQSTNKERKTPANPEGSQLLISSYFPLGSLEDEARTQGFEMEASYTLLHSTPPLQAQSPADCSVRDTALKRHGAVAVQCSADQPKHSGAYHPDVQGCETSLSSTPISFACNGHAAFLSESWSEFYMRQLLHFDLSSQDKDNDEPTHSGRKYWNLEELKLLLQEREKFWQQETGGQVVSENPLSGSRRNSREASSIYEVEDADEDHLKQRKQRVLLEEMGNSFVEDNASLDTKFVFPGPLNEVLNNQPDFQRTSNTPLARPEQTTLGDVSNAGPKEVFYSCSDTWKWLEYPSKAQDERFSSSVFQAGPLEQEADLQLASGAGRDKADDYVVMSFAEEAQLQDDIYDYFATQALDAAAHDEIMHPEEDTLEWVWDSATRIPLGADSFESNPVSQSVLPNRVSTDKPSLHCPLEAIADPSRGVLSSHGMMEWASDFRAVRRCGMEQGSIGIPSDFWRRNRLY